MIWSAWTAEGRGARSPLPERPSPPKPRAGDKGPTAQVDARWIWSHADAMHDNGGRILLRKVIKLDKLPKRAQAVATCDNEMVLYVNGKKVGESAEWSKPMSVDITKTLKVGDNVIAVEATNWPDRKHNKGTNVSGANPAAFIAWIGGFDNTIINSGESAATPPGSGPRTPGPTGRPGPPTRPAGSTPPSYPTPGKFTEAR